MRKYIVVRLVASSRKQVIRFISAKAVEEEEIIISRCKGMYFIILPGVEIGMPAQTLKKLISLAQHAMDQERFI
ncbi:hypothetical protein [Archaeoglobus sp.]